MRIATPHLHTKIRPGISQQESAGLFHSLPESIRSFVCSRRLHALIAMVALGAIPASAASARPVVRKHPRYHALTRSLLNVALPGSGLLPDYEEELPTDGKKYELKLVRAYTGEVLNVVYRIGDTYIPDALYKLNDFLRDNHNEEVTDYDPRTFDVLHTMLAKLGKTDSTVNILSAYRTQETNDMLRESGTTNAALHSQHIEAKALDLRVPGVSAVQLRDAALSLSAGGVGYYPKGGFVHVDVGPVRQWTYTPHRHHARRSRRRG
jgi:uncharacterized protein YcbK (DUF882 family)